VYFTAECICAVEANDMPAVQRERISYFALAATARKAPLRGTHLMSIDNNSIV